MLSNWDLLKEKCKGIIIRNSGKDNEFFRQNLSEVKLNHEHDCQIDFMIQEINAQTKSINVKFFYLLVLECVLIVTAAIGIVLVIVYDSLDLLSVSLAAVCMLLFSVFFYLWDFKFTQRKIMQIIKYYQNGLQPQWTLMSNFQKNPEIYQLEILVFANFE